MRVSGRVVRRSIVVVLAAACLAATNVPLQAQGTPLPYYLADRGRGIPTSLFGTYIEKGQFLVYPFYEYNKVSAFEYKPSELGFNGSEDFLGEVVEQEYLLFLSYGISDRMSAELEGAVYTTASFDKASDDPSNVPSHIEESGLGDIDMQLRWRWKEETEDRSEMFSFLEATPPLQSEDVLIGTQYWEAAFGFGMIRGHRWGTIAWRVSLAFDGEDRQFEPGEFAVEYLKRTSDRWRFVGTLEGESDEISLIGEAQLFLGPRAFVKLNCGFGLTEKAPDLAPEVGILFQF